MSEWFYYRFRCKLRSESLYGKLCRFFKADEPDFEQLEFTETQMVMEALAAYCMPLVFKRLKEIGKCSEAAFKHCGRVSFNQLIQRAYFIAHVCGLEGELILIPSLASSQPTYNDGRNGILNKSNPEPTGASGYQPVTSLATEPRLDESNSRSVAAPEAQNLLHHQDDGVFKEMFGEQ